MSLKEQIFFIYTHYRDAVYSDSYLLDHYERLNGSVRGKEDSIKRWGRKFRQWCREGQCNHLDGRSCFSRDEATLIMIKEAQQRVLQELEIVV